MREQLAGKTRVYPQKSRYTREIPERASTCRARPTPRVPAQLIGKKRRNRLAAADNTICYLTRGTFKEDQHDAGFADTRWVELEELYENCGKAQLNGAVKKYRKAEDEAVKAAIAEFEEGIED